MWRRLRPPTEAAPHSQFSLKYSRATFKITHFSIRYALARAKVESSLEVNFSPFLEEFISNEVRGALVGGKKLTGPRAESATLIADCKRSVLLPIPGSPEIKTNDPGTIPPPKTLSNSENPVDRRKLCSFLTSASLTMLSSNFVPLTLCLSVSAETSVSTRLFHEPHSGHLPRKLDE